MNSEELNKQNAITLIALIITIIIMLILAGVVLNLTLGEHGIFKTATQAGEEYKKAEIKEEIELAIIDIQKEEIIKGNEVTLETLSNGQLKDKLNGITTTLETNKITGEYKNYEYEIDNNFKVTIKEIVKGIQISYTLSKTEYTNEDIALTINATSTDGVVTQIVVPNGLTKNADGTYLITKNGTYTFSAIDDKGNQKEENIVITNIDKLNPNKPVLKISNIEETKFTVKVEAYDTEENENNSKSGIEKYEYYIDANAKFETTKSEYEFANLNKNTAYTVNVRAYDKAGNASPISSVLTKTLKGKYATLTLNGVVGNAEESDALLQGAYDGNWDEPVDVYRSIIYVDESVVGKNLKVKYEFKGNWRVVTFCSVDDKILSFTPNFEEKGVYTRIIKIPEGTSYINCGYENSKIYEMEITNEDEGLVEFIKY